MDPDGYHANDVGSSSGHHSNRTSPASSIGNSTTITTVAAAAAAAADHLHGNSTNLSLSSDGDEVTTNPTDSTIRSTPIILQILTTRMTMGGQTTHQGHIYLTPDEIDYYQDALTVYFTNKGSKVLSLLCPDIDTYLVQYNLDMVNITFVNNLPPHIINQVQWLRQAQVNKHILPSWSWLPDDGNIQTNIILPAGSISSNNVPPLSLSSISESMPSKAPSNNRVPDPEESISISSVNFSDMGMQGRKMGGRFMGDQRMGGQTYPHSFTHNNSITVDSSLSVGGMPSPFNSDASVASFTTSSNTLSYKTPESISIAPATATSNKESSASDSYKTPDEMAESISIAPATAPSLNITVQNQRFKP